MRILVRTIDNKDQRYKTVGDWIFTDPDTLIITVSDLKDDKMNCLIVIHELIEAFLCKFHDPEITTEAVDEFDMSHPELEEPGESSKAPYYKQHLIASTFEITLAYELKINWEYYEKKIREL